MIMLLVDRWWRCGGARLEMEGVVAAAVVVLLEAGAARGGEWNRGSNRSGDKKRFWGSLEKFSGGGGWWPAVGRRGGVSMMMWTVDLWWGGVQWRDVVLVWVDDGWRWVAGDRGSARKS
uniref:Uncharacterized protein n=1 Tax=Tanacetum cinerariifolium TaxID=118510 RepID=A0A699KDG8_TANCI|nr:hypothetical protein [Tanacetum cinerariifolium]